MSHFHGPDGQAPRALVEVNDRSRQLMAKPATSARAEEYRELLSLWAEVSREEFERAA
ncbi:hypothetical protein [Streptomyces sp. NPDC059215]|uniref:hypothetical protein n=1 Tax=Streptomyces sp. NPDC059215 TaxID=3346772 RepID=UPI00369329C1